MFSTVPFKFDTSLNLANLVDTVVGSVPFINNSLILKLLGVYGLGREGSTHSASTSTSTTPLGLVKYDLLVNTFLPTALNNLEFCELLNLL